MPTLSPEKVLDVLRTIKEPLNGQDLVAQDRIEGLTIQEDEKGIHVSFAIKIAPEQAAAFETLRARAEKEVGHIDGVTRVSAVLTSHKPAPNMAAQARRMPQKLSLPNLKAIIAVVSGKGGVGKSTTAVNLALAMAATGKKVGLMDADIYGPSVPHLVHMQGQPQVNADGHIIPANCYGIKAMSIGALVPETAAMIWRGPMVHSALKQLFDEVAWGELDVLLLDMPPGTGDAQLSVTQLVDLKGVVVVSTPQDLALLDVRRGVSMFQRLEIPVLGIIENMSYFLCPHCGERSDIFYHGGAEKEAARLGMPFLGGIPLDLEVRKTSDEGHPIVASMPNSSQAMVYQNIAAQLMEKF